MYFLYKIKIALNDKYSPDAAESHLIRRLLPTGFWKDRKPNKLQVSEQFPLAKHLWILRERYSSVPNGRDFCYCPFEMG